MTLFKSLGLAVEDVASARHIYEKAKASGTGRFLDFGGERHAERLSRPSIEQIRAARERLFARGLALRTPLVRLNVDDAPAEIWLKLENLQPIGSFKLRGAGNAMSACAP